MGDESACHYLSESNYVLVIILMALYLTEYRIEYTDNGFYCYVFTAPHYRVWNIEACSWIYRQFETNLVSILGSAEAYFIVSTEHHLAVIITTLLDRVQGYISIVFITSLLFLKDSPLSETFLDFSYRQFSVLNISIFGCPLLTTIDH